LGTFRAKIERTDYQASTETLVMYVVHPDGAWDAVEVQKEGAGFRTVQMVAHKRNEWRPSLTVDAGQIVGGSVAGSSAGVLAVKCSD
jgi:hypothetical protein